jgi:RimJ/RimL family protein N-acetyltransferase
MLTTERLILRQWRDEDREPFAAMGADPDVMRHFPGLLTRAESDAVIDRLGALLDQHGMTFWAVEVPGIAPFIGMVGLAPVTIDTNFTPCVEIGWRLATAFHGFGYASEAARACFRFGFEEKGLDKIVAYTATANLASQAVMNRIDMTRRADWDFDHPRVPEGSPVKRHLTWAIHAEEWQTIPR